MRRIAILNQKGGVGKTTTAVNLAAALANGGRRVCLIDLDSQAHASVHLGIPPSDDLKTSYDIMLGHCTFADARIKCAERLWILPANINLAGADVELANQSRRESLLHDAMTVHEDDFDFIIMDCAPSLSVMTLNALTTANEVFIPLQPHFFALHGLSQLLETTATVARRINRTLQVSGIVICMFEATKLAQEVIGDLCNFVNKSRGQPVPWANARVFDARIRRNIKLAECPGFGQSIFDYAPTCAGAEDYQCLAVEVLSMSAPQLVRAAA